MRLPPQNFLRQFKLMIKHFQFCALCLCYDISACDRFLFMPWLLSYCLQDIPARLVFHFLSFFFFFFVVAVASFMMTVLLFGQQPQFEYINTF